MNKLLLIIVLLLLIILLTTKILQKEHFAGAKHSSVKLNKTLKKITSDLNSHGIKNWFLGYGTLLGIVRNNSCIEGDDDIDIVIDKKESNKLHDLIRKKKYKYDKIKNKVMNFDNFTRILLGHDYAPIDFYIAKNNNCNYHETWEKVVWSDVCPIVKKDWNNVILNLPNNYKTKLKNRYGDDWRTPRNWKGPKNNKNL